MSIGIATPLSSRLEAEIRAEFQSHPQEISDLMDHQQTNELKRLGQALTINDAEYSSASNEKERSLSRVAALRLVERHIKAHKNHTQEPVTRAKPEEQS